MQRLLILFLAFCHFHSHAQDVEWVKYLPGEELPFTYAYSTAQDNRGLLWFSAGNAVYHYTGSQYKKIEFKKNTRFDFIHKIKCTPDETFFIGLNTLYQLVDDSIAPCFSARGIDIIDIIKKGQQWWLFTNNGFYVSSNLKGFASINGLSFSNRGNSFQCVYPLSSNLLTSFILGEKLIFFNAAGKKYYSAAETVMAMCQDKRGKIFYITKDSGVYTIDNATDINGKLVLKKRLFFKHQFPLVKSLSLAFDNRENLWVTASGRGIICVDSTGNMKYEQALQQLPGDIGSIQLLDKEGNLWLNRLNGLLKIKTERGLKFTKASGLFDDAANIFTNGGGVFWVTTKWGINIIKNNSIICSYRYQQPHENLVTLLPYGNGAFVLRLNELYEYRLQNSQITEKKWLSSPAERFTDMVVLPGGDLLISTVSSAFLWQKGKTQLLPGIKGDIRNIIAYQNFIVTGGHAGGLYLYNFVFENNKPYASLLDSSNVKAVRSIYPAINGDIWVGTKNTGIHKFTIKDGKLKQQQYFGASPGFDMPFISGFTDSSENLLYVYTANGTYELRKQRDSFVLSLSKFFPKGIYTRTLVKDREGSFWISSEGGIEKLTAMLIRASTVYNAFVTEARSSAASYFFPGSHRGLFAHSSNTIELRFGCNYFTDEKKVQYSYALDTDDTLLWSSPSNAAVATLLSLPPGKYRFFVKAFLPTGGETAPDIFSFTIQTPFWKTAWFYLLCAAAASGVVYYLYRIKINRIRAEERLRNKIARDLHDDIGSTLSGINLFSKLALNKIDNGDDDVKDIVGKISSRSASIMDAMSDIVWSINPANDAVANMLVRMKEYAAEMLEAKDICYRFETNEKINGIQLGLGVRKEIFLIFKETINNSVKHSGCGNVVIILETHNNMLCITVEDDGKGMEGNNKKNGNGLVNMQQRAMQVKGILNISSAEGKGTFVKLQVPIT